MNYISLTVTFIVLFLCAGLSGAQAQYVSKKFQNSPAVMHAGRVAKVCAGDWRVEGCLRAVSDSTLVMAANYAGILQARAFPQAVGKVKQHCAAAGAFTALEQENIPDAAAKAAVMKSAWVECANMVYDLSEETGVKPDQSHYQLLVGAILCLEKDRRCEAVEDGLRRYR